MNAENEIVRNLSGSTPTILAPPFEKLLTMHGQQTTIAVINFSWGVPLDTKVLSALAHARGFQIWWKNLDIKAWQI